MDAAWDLGINFFDTADAYGGGRSESYIGAWLKAKGAAVRDQLLLSSKVFNPVGDGPNDRGPVAPADRAPGRCQPARGWASTTWTCT